VANKHRELSKQKHAEAYHDSNFKNVYRQIGYQNATAHVYKYNSVTVAAVLSELLCIRDGSYSIEFEDSIRPIIYYSILRCFYMFLDGLDVFFSKCCVFVFVQFVCTIFFIINNNKK